MKIANWYENCKAILTFQCIVPMWTFAIFIWDTAGMKTCSETERMFPFNYGVDDKNSMNWSLAKPSTIHKYFNTKFLCGHSLIHILSHVSSALLRSILSQAKKHLLHVGWRNFFSICAVVSGFWFLAGNRFWCYLLTHLEYNRVVALC